MKKYQFKTVMALALILLTGIAALAARTDIPAVYGNISVTKTGELVYQDRDGNTLPLLKKPAEYTLQQMRSSMRGTETGIRFNFADSTLQGSLYYGLINSDEARYSNPIYYHTPAKLTDGIAEIDIKKRLHGKYDFTNWEETGIVSLGYRVVTDQGLFLYDGKIRLKGTGPFEIGPCIIEGPFVNLITPEGATVSFETNFPVVGEVKIDGLYFSDETPDVHHEITVTGLSADRDYEYVVEVDGVTERYAFHTAPRPEDRTAFTFAYASDSRSGAGAGERDLYGVNKYMLRRIGAAALDNEVRFIQFTGDLVSGYKLNKGELQLEYANWKRTIEPFAHYIPVIPAIGNHEALGTVFDNGGWGVFFDKFPFNETSSEKVFADNFVNPLNGPISEDGSKYDPDPESQDFPPYAETVFYYTYGNVAVIAINSDYWYAPSIRRYPEGGGNLHGYIMDNQLDWCRRTLEKLEQDSTIEHIFVTQHTPILPNGGHVKDDMWYNGNNQPRPTIAGQPVEKGIIQRRDEFLDLLVNQSSKVVAVLTGDEHNYNRLLLTADTPIYPEDYPHSKLELSRSLWLINNGAAGAPYYAREYPPWSDALQRFSTQNAVVLFKVDGQHILAEVINPDTLEKVDAFVLK
ncbi:MAG: hypothetical protein GXO91_10075 [FCB group bacterium]|nr:hypothetical protein [FCB group bacterium]